jgi:DNA-binding Xre family transcriptional regulator
MRYEEESMGTIVKSRVGQILDQLQISQRAVYIATGISPTTINKLAKNQEVRDIDIVMSQKIAAYLGLNWYDLYETVYNTEEETA